MLKPGTGQNLFLWSTAGVVAVAWRTYPLAAAQGGLTLPFRAYLVGGDRITPFPLYRAHTRSRHSDSART